MAEGGGKRKRFSELTNEERAASIARTAQEIRDLNKSRELAASRMYVRASTPPRAGGVFGHGMYTGGGIYTGCGSYRRARFSVVSRPSRSRSRPRRRPESKFVRRGRVRSMKPKKKVAFKANKSYVRKYSRRRRLPLKYHRRKSGVSWIYEQPGMSVPMDSPGGASGYEASGGGTSSSSPPVRRARLPTNKKRSYDPHIEAATDRILGNDTQPFNSDTVRQIEAAETAWRSDQPGHYPGPSFEELAAENFDMEAYNAKRYRN